MEGPVVMGSEGTFLRESETLRDLRVLEEIEKNPAVSQRELARTLGVAVGLANACVATLARKGMLKVRGENNRSITYHLTKQGLIHKSRLAMQWTRNTVSFYIQARSSVATWLTGLAREGVTTVAFLGATELAEIAVLTAPEAGLTVTCVIALDADDSRTALAGASIHAVTGEVPHAEVLVVCAPVDAERIEAARSAVGATRVASLMGDE